MRHLIVTIIIIFSLGIGYINGQSTAGVDGLTAWWTTAQQANELRWQDELHQTSLPALCETTNSLINFNVAFEFCPQAQLAPIYLTQSAQTIVTVAFPKTRSEQTIWSLSHADTTQFILTNHRMADLHERAYMNFPKQNNAQPFLYTYLGEAQPAIASDFNCLFQIGHQGRRDIPTEQFEGFIPEILIFDHPLSSRERNKIESALAIKYGLSISNFQSPHYISSTGQIIWDGITDELFSSQIAGIGRDDQSKLFQKQSRSSAAGSILTIALDKKARSNYDNTSQLNDQSFLIWGNNKETLEINDHQNTIKPLAREWRIKQTNFESPQSTSVYFDMNAINTYIARDESLYLMIDRSSSGNYHIKDTEYYSLDIKNDEATISQILWDIDESGSDQFRLAIAPEFFGKYSVDESDCDVEEKAKLHIGAEGGKAPYQFTLSDPYGVIMQWEKQDNTVELIENLDAGIYYYSVVDNMGKTYTETVIIENKSKDQFNIIKEISLSENHVDWFDPTSIGITNYTWVSPNGDIHLDELIQFSDPGMYTILANTDNCVNVYTILAHREEESRRSIQFNTFPNPTVDGRFTATITCDNPSTIEYQLTTVDGKVLQQIKLAGRTQYIFHGNLPNKGQYILSAKSSEYSSASSIIFQ